MRPLLLIAALLLSVSALAAGPTLTLTPYQEIGCEEIIGESVGRMTLGAPAGAGGQTVTLSSNNAAATVPASLDIAEGEVAGEFPVDLHPVPAKTIVAIKATAGVTVQANVTVRPNALQSVQVTPPTLPGGTTITGTLTLKRLAPVGGQPVTLESENTAIIGGSVTIPEGSASVPFELASYPVSETTTLPVVARCNGSSNTVNVTLTAPPVLAHAGSPDTCDPVRIDGKWAILSFSSDTSEVFWLEQPATAGGTWTRHAIGVLPPADPAILRTVPKLEACCWADFTGDGRWEAVAGDQTNGEVWVFQAPDPRGEWTATKAYTNRYAVHDLLRCELNGDHWDEVLCAYEGSDALTGGIISLRWYGGAWRAYPVTRHPGAWQFAHGHRVPGGFPKLADFDGDSAANELLFDARSNRNPGAVAGLYYLTKPVNPFQAWPETTVWSTTEDSLHGDFGDFSGDGHGYDICGMSMGPTPGLFTFRRNAGWAQESLPSPWPVGRRPFNLYNLGDDGSGRDALITVVEHDYLYRLAWDGAQYAATRAVATGYSHPFDGAIFRLDLDGDGATELLIADSGGCKIWRWSP